MRLRYEPHFQVKMYKPHHSRTTFGRSDAEKVHAAVGRSTFPSRNVQNTFSDHFWKDRCRKTFMRREAHVQVKMLKNTLGEVGMWKNCTPLWHEAQAHFQFKTYKTHHSRTTFRSSHMSKSKSSTKHSILEHFWEFRCGKSARSCGRKHISKSDRWLD